MCQLWPNPQQQLGYFTSNFKMCLDEVVMSVSESAWTFPMGSSIDSQLLSVGHWSIEISLCMVNGLGHWRFVGQGEVVACSAL